MNVELNEHQALILMKALDSYLSELRAEICATENKEYRDDLKLREETLTRIMSQMKIEAEKKHEIEPPVETIH